MIYKAELQNLVKGSGLRGTHKKKIRPLANLGLVTF
jgi:hypothetical protein